MTTCNVIARPDPDALPVLALDLATACGWALRTAATISSGTESFAERRGESRGDRLWRFQQWLAAHHAAQPLSMIAYERAQGPMRGAAQACYAQFEGVLLAWAAKRRVPVRAVPVTTLKKAVAGSGRASKIDVTRTVTDELGVVPGDDNESDALAVLLWATRQ